MWRLFCVVLFLGLEVAKRRSCTCYLSAALNSVVNDDGLDQGGDEV